jgi:DNA-binding LacI/PurR family transcriptional regulator
MNTGARKVRAFERATAFLDRQISALQSGRAKVTRLPVIKTLASDAKVSKQTMQKAVRGFVDKGILSAQHGRGIHIVSGANQRALDATLRRTAQSGGTSSKRAWERVRSAVLNDLAADAFPPGTVFSSKELCRRYGVCHATLRKALHQSSVLKPYKRGFCYQPQTRKHSKSTIILIAISSDIKALLEYSTRSQEFWRTLERECRANHISFPIVDIAEVQKTGGIPSQYMNGTVLGYAILTYQIGRETIGWLTQVLPSKSVPIIIVDDSGITPMEINPPKAYIVARTGDYAAGREVGNYLLAQGHRSASCFCLAPGVEWSDLRAKGIRDVYAEAGLASVHVFHSESIDSWGQLFEDKPLNRTSRAAHSRAEAIRRLFPSHERSEHESFFFQTQSYLMSHLDKGRFYRNFRKAAALDGVNAWVMCNDRVATYALSFLASEGRDVSKGKLVIGFDDLVESFGLGLTSYNFNMSAIASAVIRFILYGPDSPRARTLVVPGFIVERNSTVLGDGSPRV